MSLFRKYWKDEFGGGAAEFAIVLMPFAALIFAIIHLCLVFFANQSLQFAAEAAARCYSVDSITCSSTGAVQTYATNHYKGPNITPVFAVSGTGCGHTVNGNGTYQLNAVFVRIGVPLTATACFP
jgi:Flp pilus assembly protein TadG